MANPASTSVGYRFHPTDEELVGHYLKHKLLGNDFMVHHVITEIDVCQFEPWKLPAYSKVKSDDPEWFFLSPIALMSTKDTRNRCNRKTKAGFWKPTGKDRKIKSGGTKNVIGTKKTLVFYEGRSSRGVKTNWVIHEYHAVTSAEDKGSFVLCRLMDKADKKAEMGTDTLMYDQGEPISHSASDFESQEMEEAIRTLFTLPEEMNLESIFATPSQAQEPSSRGSSLPSAIFGEENCNSHIPLETNEEKDNLDKFMDEILAGGDADETMPGEIDGNSNSVNSVAENRPLKEEGLGFIDMVHCLRGEVVRLNFLLSTLAEELAAVKAEADQVEYMKKNLADVRSQIRSAAADVEKLIAVKDEEEERLVNLKRKATKVGLDLESEWASMTTEVKEIQEPALQNHVRSFDRCRK